MAVGLAKSVSLVLLLLFVTTVHSTRCAKPRVRREWRSLSDADRKKWLAAVNVGSSNLK